MNDDSLTEIMETIEIQNVQGSSKDPITTAAPVKELGEDQSNLEFEEEKDTADLSKPPHKYLGESLDVQVEEVKGPAESSTQSRSDALAVQADDPEGTIKETLPPTDSLTQPIQVEQFILTEDDLNSRLKDTNPNQVNEEEDLLHGYGEYEEDADDTPVPPATLDYEETACNSEGDQG